MAEETTINLNNKSIIKSAISQIEKNLAKSQLCYWEMYKMQL